MVIAVDADVEMTTDVEVAVYGSLSFYYVVAAMDSAEITVDQVAVMTAVSG